MPSPNPTCTIFYSWQRQLPEKNNRYFIEKSAENAARSVRNDATIDARPDVDQATANVPGSPDIFDTIRSKIDVAEVVVCDVSIVQGSEGDGEHIRPTPNPNVLVELGYAMKSLGTMERVVLVMNTCYGDHKKLPFDLQKYRLTPYSLPASATEDERRSAGKALSSKLKNTFSHVLAKPSRRVSAELTRCGSVYWMANNIVYAAFALAENRLPDALREWNHAIHHAQQLPIPSEHIAKLRSLQRRDITDADIRHEVVRELQGVWTDIGQFVQAHQADFLLRDVQSDTA